MTTKCDCKFNDITKNGLIQDNEILNSLVGEVFDIINSSNILVLKCIKYMFKHFSRSIGGWISLFSIIVFIAMVLLYFFVDIKKMQIFVMKFTDDFLEYISKEKSSNLDIKSANNYPPKKLRSIKNKKNEEEKDNIDEKKSVPEKLNNKTIESIKGNKKMISSSSKVIVFKKRDFQVTEKNELNSDFFREYFKDSPDDMEFDDALVYDKRTFCEMFSECSRDKQIIASTFIAKDELKPRSIKIIVFILNFILYFVINGLFFSESVIEELYDLDESKEHFFSYFTRMIDRMIYCTLVSIVIGYIEDFFFIGIKKFKDTYLREKDNIKILRGKIVDLLNSIKRRNIAFIVVIGVLLLFSFIYLCCFNYVYPYTQKEWIKSSITIFIIMQILSLLKCLLIVSLRTLNFKEKSEKLYKISKLFD